MDRRKFHLFDGLVITFFVLAAITLACIIFSAFEQKRLIKRNLENESVIKRFKDADRRRPDRQSYFKQVVVSEGCCDKPGYVSILEHKGLFRETEVQTGRRSLRRSSLALRGR